MEERRNKKNGFYSMVLLFRSKIVPYGKGICMYMYFAFRIKSELKRLENA